MKPKKQTKRDLVENIYAKTGHDLKDIKSVVDCFLNELKNALEQNQSVELRGFGTFEIRNRKGREKARNPKTGEIVSVEDHAVVAFRSGKDLKNSVWSIPSRTALTTDVGTHE